jgi:stage III sporulation protein AH
MKIWKKNLIAVAILLTVCGGIYANWVYSEQQAAIDLTQTLDAEKILSEDTLVMSQLGSEPDPDMNTMSEYFAAVRLSRQEARDSAVALLQEAMAYESDGSSASSSQLEEIVQTALCEAQIESLIIAKGYADCVVYISDEGISVAVAAPEGGLKSEDVAVIADIVMTQSSFVMDQIRVVEVQ